MATFVKLRNGKTKAIVRRKELNGKARTLTGSREEVERWAREIEHNLDKTGTSVYHDLKEAKVGGILRAYRDEQVPNLKDYQRTTYRINGLLANEPFCHLDMTQDVSAALREYRDKCLKPKAEGGYGLKPGTATRNLGVISSAFAWAIEERGLKIPINPAHAVKRPEGGSGGRREHLWSEDLLEHFLKAANFDPDAVPTTQTSRLPWMLKLARVTGWRRGEICNIQNQTPRQAALRDEPRWRGYIDLSVPEVFFPGTEMVGKKKMGGTKNNTGFHAPLTAPAVEIITKMLEFFPTPETQDYDLAPPTLFGVKAEAHGSYWGRLRTKVIAEHPELDGIVPHELRHTFTTELVEAFADPETGEVGVADEMSLLAMTGRKSVASLKHYFHPKAQTLAQRMNRALGFKPAAPAKPAPRRALRIVKA